MKKIRVAINGAGRIGRTFYKLASESPELEVVAVNDLGDKDNIEYLLKHDTVYGKWEGKFDVTFLQEKDPSKLPWKDLDIDVVVESTGAFAKYEGARAHLDAGAKRVVVTAPMKDDPQDDIPGATVLMGVNEDKLETSKITSNASCTTNAGSPLISILDEYIGVEKAVLNTIHGYTATQNLVDGPGKDYRKARAAAQNIVPTTTGAAIAITKAFTKLEGKFDGIATRVPVVSGSIVDITFIAKKDTTEEEVNKCLKEASQSDRWKDVFAVTEEDLVSSDILGSKYGSIADLSFTRVIDGNLVKVMGWYDNEMGYCYTLLNHVIKSGNKI